MLTLLVTGIAGLLFGGMFGAMVGKISGNLIRPLLYKLISALAIGAFLLGFPIKEYFTNRAELGLDSLWISTAAMFFLIGFLRSVVRARTKPIKETNID